MIGHLTREQEREQQRLERQKDQQSHPTRAQMREKQGLEKLQRQQLNLTSVKT